MTSLKPVTAQTTWAQTLTAPIAGAVSSAVTAGGMFASTALNSYSLVKSLWNNLDANPNLGWYSKALLATTAVPAAFFSANAISPTVGSSVGLFRGYNHVLEGKGGVISAAKQSLEDVKTADKYVFNYHPLAMGFLGEWLASDLPHEPAYDVPLVQGIRTFYNSIGASAVTSAYALWRTVARSATFVPRLISQIADDQKLGLGEKAALISGVLLATPRAYASSAVAGGVAGYFAMLKTGYTDGLDAGDKQFRQMLKDIYTASRTPVGDGLDGLAVNASELGGSIQAAAMARIPASVVAGALEAAGRNG